MSIPIMLGVPVFREDKAMVEGAIRSFLDPLVDVVVIDNGASEEAKAGIETFRGTIEIVRNPTNIFVNPACTRSWLAITPSTMVIRMFRISRIFR